MIDTSLRLVCAYGALRKRFTDEIYAYNGWLMARSSNDGMTKLDRRDLSVAIGLLRRYSILVAYFDDCC